MQGILRRADIGLNDRQLATAVRTGRLRAVARGWYALPGADEEVVRTLRLGTRLTCLSAARLYGLWVPDEARSRLHVAIRRGDASPVRQGVVVHRLRSGGWPTSGPVLDVADCLDHVLRYHPVETGLMVLESAVNRGVVTESAARGLIGRVPLRKRRAGLQHFDPRSESGSETRVRLWIQRRNRPVRSQVQVAGVGRVDLLVGDSLVIEVDSRAHHTGQDAYQKDRLRDLLLMSLGFVVLRLTWEQIFLSWPATVRLLERLLRMNRHRLPLGPEASVHLPGRRAA